MSWISEALLPVRNLPNDVFLRSACSLGPLGLKYATIKLFVLKHTPFKPFVLKQTPFTQLVLKHTPFTQLVLKHTHTHTHHLYKLFWNIHIQRGRGLEVDFPFLLFLKDENGNYQEHFSEWKFFAPSQSYHIFKSQKYI